MQNLAIAAAVDLRASIDREIDGTIGTLLALATSPSLMSGDLASFYKQAKSVLDLKGSAIAVRRPDGQQLLNTLVPWGQPLPASSDPVLRAADRLAVNTRRPQVSDLYIGAVAKRPFVLVVVPVVIGDEVRYLLNIAIEPRLLSELIGRQIRPQWTSAVVDGNFKIVARSRLQEKFLGQSATPDVRANVTGREGTWHATTLEGTTTFAAYSASRIANWKIIVGIPWSELSGPLVRSAWGWGAVVLLALAIAGIASWYIALRITEAVRSLAAASNGAPPVPATGQVIRTGFAEIDEVGESLRRGAQRLQTAIDRIEQQRRSAEELSGRFEIAEQAARGFVFQRRMDTGAVWHSPGVARVLGYEPRDIADDLRWLTLIHPEDRDGFRNSISAEALERAGGFEIRCRVRRQEGDYIWLSFRARLETDPTGGRFLTGSAVDVTAEREAAAHRELLLHELAHRGKNMLAMIQSVANQSLTGPNADGPKAFTGRLQVISRVYSSLIRLEWQGLSMNDIFVLGAGEYSGIVLLGPNVSMSAKSALILALTVHELARAGQATPEGGRRLEWRLADGGMEFDWRDSGRTALGKGFESFFLTRVVALEFSTSPVIEQSEQGLRYCLMLPPFALHAAGPSLKQSSEPAQSAVPGAAAKSDVPREASARDRVLLVEDELLIGLDAKSMIETLGYEVVGPIGTLQDALEVLERGQWQAAVLDVNLGGEKVWPLAQALLRNNVRVAFLTGYASLSSFPDELSKLPRLEKPISEEELKRFLPARS